MKLPALTRSGQTGGVIQHTNVLGWMASSGRQSEGKPSWMPELVRECPHFLSFITQIFMEGPLSLGDGRQQGVPAIAGVSRATWSEFKS